MCRRFVDSKSPLDRLRQEVFRDHSYVRSSLEAEANAEDRARALAQIQAFQGTIPGLLETVAGTNISPRAQGYTLGAMMRFTDQTSLDNYQVSAPHMALLSWLVPLIDGIDIDLVAP